MAAKRYGMASRVKITVSISEDIERFLARASRRRRIPKSRLVEEALRMAQRRELERELRQGYEAMAGEDREAAEHALAAMDEVIE